MPDVQVGDVVRVSVMMHDVDNNLIENVFYYQNAGPGTALPSGLPAYLGQQVEALFNYLIPNQTYSLVYDNLTYYNMTTKEPLGEHAPLVVDQGDNITYDPMPSGCAALVIGDTGYSRSRPKKFVPGLHENLCEGNIITSSAFLGNLTNFALYWLTSFYDTFNDINWIPGTWHKLTPTTGEFRGLIATIVKDIIAFQRRRKPGVGQ
jgi:hypothetical protein